MTTTLPIPSALELRQEFVDMIYRDLHGPAGGEHEIVTESNVRDRYLVGALAPKNKASDDTPGNRHRSR
ncbi:MAG UNVERIFIED_CONTAM: hypothetical protein LVT10_00840 [Anaerolineae bacterium]|jgi:hypothetical protein